MSRQWSEEDVLTLDSIYPDPSVHIEELSVRLKRSVNAIHLKANKMGFLRSLNEVMKHQKIRSKISKRAQERLGPQNSFYGKKHKVETIEHMKEKLRTRFSGSGNPFYGKRHTADAKVKMSQSKKFIFLGENNPAWRGGYEPYYGPNWEEQHRRALERDAFSCQKCFGRERLEVHHIMPFRLFEHDYEAANDLDNLQTFCIHCHRRMNGGEGKESARLHNIDIVSIRS